ncbi:hypothetical protein CPC08DRAFT_705487 [Agrocybe pediades]|nr:hypothetical protein CPC08DRAFT_705487 [Agrocybe pediades]
MALNLIPLSVTPHIHHLPGMDVQWEAGSFDNARITPITFSRRMPPYHLRHYTNLRRGYHALIHLSGHDFYVRLYALSLSVFLSFKRDIPRPVHFMAGAHSGATRHIGSKTSLPQKCEGQADCCQLIPPHPLSPLGRKLQYNKRFADSRWRSTPMGPIFSSMKCCQ